MADPRTAIDQSIQSHVKDDNLDRTALVVWLASANEVISPWWSRRRDKDLRDFWRRVDMLAGAVYALEAKMATIPFHIEPKDLTVRAHIEQADRFQEMLLNASEFGKGWPSFYAKWTQDLLTQDNGAFAEIIGAGDPAGPILGMPTAVVSLDAGRCDRTSSPEYPVVYLAGDGKRYKLHYTRVAFASIQASPVAEMHDVGFCAVSKCLNVSQNLLDILVYNQEKLGSRPQRNILVSSGGLTPDNVRDAFKLATESMDNQMLSRYSKTVVVGGPSAPEAKLEQIDLASVPDGFSYETSMTMGMAAIALAFGVDARELWPMTSTGATRADAMIQHLKAQTKGIGHLLQIAEQAIFSKVLPETLTAEFDYTDDAADRQAAEIKKIRSDRHAVDLTAEAVDDRTVREQMLSDGDLSQAQFDALEMGEGRLEDGTPILQVFYAAEYADMLNLGLPDPLDLAAVDKEEIAPLIEDKRKELIMALGMVKNFRNRAQVMVGLAALDALEEYYDDVPELVPPALVPFAGLNSPPVAGEQPAEQPGSPGSPNAVGEQAAEQPVKPENEPIGEDEVDVDDEA